MSLKQITKFIGFVTDILFPIICVECQKEGEWWCTQCLSQSQSNSINLCPVCNCKTIHGETCVNCRGVSYLDGVTAFFKYNESAAVGKLIKNFKYNYARGIIDVWRQIINNRLSEISAFNYKAVVVPVPLHSRRLRERGFNQAGLLAQIIGASLNLKLEETGLKRIRYTNQQARLTGMERRQNLKSAFVWNMSVSVPYEVILVDDVFTTGATMQQCARILKAVGVKKVWGLVMARG